MKKALFVSSFILHPSSSINMATLPTPPNMTCDIWRSGNLGNPSPDVANVQCALVANYLGHTEHGEKDPVEQRFTHTMLMPVGTDCRDGYDEGTYGNNPDNVTIPAGATAANYTIFDVIFVETKAKGTPQEHLKVYLDRVTPEWPTKYT
jgi:hypothetical protein